MSDLQVELDDVENAAGGLEAMIERLKKRGYYVYERNPEKELLEEMYYCAIFGGVEFFLNRVNDLFRLRLNTKIRDWK